MKEPDKCQSCGSGEKIIGQDYDKTTHEFNCYLVLVKDGKKYRDQKIYLCSECTKKFWDEINRARRNHKIKWGKKLKEVKNGKVN